MYKVRFDRRLKIIARKKILQLIFFRASVTNKRVFMRLTPGVNVIKLLSSITDDGGQ